MEDKQAHVFYGDGFPYPLIVLPKLDMEQWSYSKLVKVTPEG